MSVMLWSLVDSSQIFVHYVFTFKYTSWNIYLNTVKQCLLFEGHGLQSPEVFEQKAHS